MDEQQRDIWDRLGKMVSSQMKERDVPGVVVGILHRGEKTVEGFGITNVEHPLPVTDTTYFQIGSITKTFTGTAIQRLVEQGKIDLNATIKTYLPDFSVADRDASDHATIKHLLTHMGGWVGDLFVDTGPGDDAIVRYVAKMAELEQLAPLGTVWSYNNAGFSVAGLIVEVVTGKTYVTALKELVLEPLGLQEVFFDAGDVITRRFAVGHTVSADGPQVALPWPLPRAINPVGGIITNIHELLRYAGFHLGDGGMDDKTRLLTSESMNQIHSPQADIRDKEAWGITWAVDDSAGVRQISHGGGTVGQITELSLIPERDFAVAILTNANRGGSLIREILQWVKKEYLGIETPKPTPNNASEEELKSFVGYYSRPFMDIELGMINGRLIGQAIIKEGFPTKDTPPPPPPPPFSADVCEKDRLVLTSGPFEGSLIDVVRKDDGSIGWIRTGGRIHSRRG